MLEYWEQKITQFYSLVSFNASEISYNNYDWLYTDSTQRKIAGDFVLTYCCSHRNDNHCHNTHDWF